MKIQQDKKADDKCLYREAFDLKHELKEDTAHDDAAAEQFIMNGFQNQVR